jgi:hypothetical protein
MTSYRLQHVRLRGCLEERCQKFVGVHGLGIVLLGCTASLRVLERAVWTDFRGATMTVLGHLVWQKELRFSYQKEEEQPTTSAIAYQRIVEAEGCR